MKYGSSADGQNVRGFKKHDSGEMSDVFFEAGDIIRFKRRSGVKQANRD